ncbi:MAG: sensor histidine kinase [Pseudomonadota bacterium]
MEPAGDQAGLEADHSQFFIPDLCASRSLLVLILLAELLLIVYVLATSALPRFDWYALAYGSFVVQWIVLLSAALLCRLRVPLSRLGLPVASVCSLLTVLGVTVASSYLARWLFPQFSSAAGDAWWLLRNLLMATVVACILLRYFYLQHQLRRQQLLESQARLDSLRSRIRPHFLFNTLNSIASLIVSRPEAAEQAVEDLSELFRTSLQEEQRSTTVADELRVCELYLGIESLRLGDRLQVDWQVGDAVRTQPMPSLLLQPLVENAIYHGISQLAEGGCVGIEVELRGGEVIARVENPVPTADTQREGNRLALENIRERLAVMYGAAGKLSAAKQGGVFRVVLSYPQELLA